MIARYLLFMALLAAPLFGQAYQEFASVPTLYMGRVKPAMTSAKEWASELPLPLLETVSPLELLLTVQLRGWKTLSNSYLFKEEQNTGIWTPKELFDYQGENEVLRRASSFFKDKLQEDPYILGFHKLKGQGMGEEKIIELLNQSLPLHKRLLAEPVGFLPSKVDPRIWYPLSALSLLVRKEGSWQNLRSFSTYSQETLEKLLKASSKDAAALLLAEYELLSDVPAFWRIKLETLYQNIAFIPLLAAVYAASACLLFLPNKLWGILAFIAAFLIHLSLLLARSLILFRPPVSNMEETIFFVPFTAVICASFIAYIWRSTFPLFLAAIASVLLFALLWIFSIEVPLSSLQPVLNSNFWLSIHVLMVVGSYGFFLLSSISAHIALPQKKTPLLDRLTLVTQMAGLALLIPGTILGGVWAQESWGRFWDWDPKEAWAFIACCFSLIAIHLYRFGKISTRLFSLLAAISFQLITFTWYGVNFILGVGLHSYGFGTGGEIYYYLFIALDSVYLIGSYLYGNRLK